MTSSGIEKEYNEINRKDAWFAAFQSIKDKCETEAQEKRFTLNQSKSVNNKKYNRYRDVNPYDHSRIILHRGDTDYINANLVKLERANRKYILTQGPLQQTVSHFWLMAWEHNSKAILMLNKLIEKNQIKCHLYWPGNTGEVMYLMDVGLTVEYLKYEEFNHFSVRTLRLTDIESTKSREILQFHYTTWPDFGIPSSPVAFLQFLKQVRDSGALDADVGPPIVHCSAGIGRSGTFCLVDCCLVLIENEGENKVSVQDILQELRRYRMGLIQTVDQLYFSYQAIIEGIKRINDPNYNNDYEEVPFISHELDENEDAPPPLPPKRIDSLQVNITPKKPLPSIPNSESLHEELMSTLYGNDSKEAIKNSTNSKEHGTDEINKNFESNNIDRPLPPLPKENSLEKVEESDSDEADEIEENDSSSGEEENNENYDNEGDRSNERESLLKESFDPDATLPPSPKYENNVNGLDMSNESFKSDEEIEKNQSSELRRRKRQERQAAMADKVREIKRKQKLCEEKASPKKRRHQVRNSPEKADNEKL